MGSVSRFLTFADVDDRDPRALSISARLVAEVADRRHIVLLDDRGWSSSNGVAGQTAEEVEQTARMVVGPDEPRGDWTRAQMESNHWATLEQKLRGAEVDIAGTDMRTLVNDVEISDRLRRLLKPTPTA